MNRTLLLGLLTLLVIGCTTYDERTAWERHCDAAAEYGDRGHFKRAFKECDAAIRLAQESGPATADSLLASSITLRGYLYEAQGDDPAAEREYLRAIELWSKAGSVVHGGIAKYTLASLYERQARGDEALLWLARIPAPMRAAVGADNRVAACLAAQRRYHEADSVYALEVARLAVRHGADHWVLARGLLCQARVRLAANEPVAAAPLLERAASTLLSAPEPVSPELLAAMDACEAALTRAGETAAAASINARARALRDRQPT